MLCRYKMALQRRCVVLVNPVIECPLHKGALLFQSSETLQDWGNFTWNNNDQPSSWQAKEENVGENKLKKSGSTWSRGHGASHRSAWFGCGNLEGSPYVACLREWGITLRGDLSSVECDWRKDVWFWLSLPAQPERACWWKLLAVGRLMAAGKTACSSNHWGR